MAKIIFWVIACLGTLSQASTVCEINNRGEGGQTLEAMQPNDPLFGRQWGLSNHEFGHDINALKAWQIKTGKKNIAIVVIGTGIDYTHPDLINNVWVNPGEIAGNGIDDDSNGYIDDVHGINAIDGTGDPMDDQGHETLVAGIIGAEANNGIGIAGVMHHVSLIACKFLNEAGDGTTSDAIKCLDYVASLAKRDDTCVTIVATNNAWGGGPFSEDLEKAIKRQRDLGILFVTTAGNEALNLDEEPMYPASYDVSNIIVVGKIDADGRHRDSGSFGPNTVHLGAPGAHILSTWINGSYKEVSGSLSTGYASGILGLIKSHQPSLSWAQLKHKLIAGTNKLPFEEEQNRYISGGYCDAFNSLQ